MRALALAFALFLTCCGGSPEDPPKPFDLEACQLRCYTLCSAMTVCGIRAGDIPPGGAEYVMEACYEGCGIGLVEVTRDRGLDSDGLENYCDANRVADRYLPCSELWGTL